MKKTFVYHVQEAWHQRDASRATICSLPIGHTVHWMDYSENYTFVHPNEVQQEYFGHMQATLHVSVIFRHASIQLDGIQSTDDLPIIIKDYVFMISDDKTHDAAVSTQPLVGPLHHFLA